MAGSSFYISLNGRRFALPKDLEPEVTIGGLVNEEGLRNGDGTVTPRKTVVPGAIRGLTPRARHSNGDLEALQAISGQTGVNIVYVGPDATFTGTGFLVVSEDGIKMNQGTDLTEAFDFMCENGQPLKKQ